MGVYQVRNLENGKILHGRALDLHGRLNQREVPAQEQPAHEQELQRDFNELGEERFAFEVLDRLAAKDGTDHDYSLELKALEEIWLEKRQPYGAAGYHIRKP